MASLPTTGASNSTRVLRCVIVGTGDIAREHARSVIDYPHAELVGISDRSRAAAEVFAARWGDPAIFDDYTAMLAELKPDVVCIATPPGVHHDQALEAMALGAHVIVEKPAATSLDEFASMTSAAKAAEVRLSVIFQQRTGTAAARVKELLDSGALGRPLLAVCQTLWFRDPSYYAVPWRGAWATEAGGTTLGHGIHQIDLMSYLLGEWESVQGRIWRLDRETETEDASTATITFRSGAVAQATTSAVSPRQTSSVRIDTERATITVEHLYGHGHENWTITPAPGFEDQAENWTFGEYEERSDHAWLFRDVLDAIIADAPVPSVAEAPERSFEIVGAIYASADADGAIITPEILAAHPTHRTSFATRVADRRPGHS